MNYFFEGINTDKWNLFDVDNVGRIERFSATSDMKKRRYNVCLCWKRR
jgi:hypothetical protein